MKRLAVQSRQALPTSAARSMMRAAASRAPAVHRLFRRVRAILKPASLTADLPRYSYGVWLGHLGEAHARGLPRGPGTVCEIGPGATVGAGLAALISGADRYVAIDGAWAWDTERNLTMFDALAELFRRRAPRDSSGGFPAHVLTDERMERCLEPERLRRIRESIVRVNRDGSRIRYIVQKGGDPMRALDGSVDMVFSQAVMEHVGDLSLAYERMSRWLAPGGFMSHEIDFRCHLSARDWNGHWAYSDPVWAVIHLGMEPLINRVPCSEHIRLMRLHGFDPVVERRRRDRSGIARSMLAPRFRDMSAEDLATRGVFVQAVKPRRERGGAKASRRDAGLRPGRSAGRQRSAAWESAIAL